MIRKSISFSILFSFIILLVSSVILYVVPEGRVAYWSNWTIWGLSKTQWGAIHITCGVLFLVLSIWHLILNYKAIVFYIKKIGDKDVLSPVPVLVALLLNLFFVIGTLNNWQPMKQLLAWNSEIKLYQAKTNGNPPYGHAELSSLESFCGFLGLDINQVVKVLKEELNQSEITRKTTINEIAKANGITPQQVYEIIRKTIPQNSMTGLPVNPPEGTGKITLEQFCKNFNLSLDVVEKKLSDAGLEVSSEKTFKEIAEQNQLSAHEVYKLIREE